VNNRQLQIEKNSSPFAAARVDSEPYKAYCKYVRGFIPPYNIKRHQTMLDLGASYGHETRELRKSFPLTSVYGIDLDMEFCKHVPSSVVGDMQLLPFRSESFDIIYSNQCYEHSPDIGMALVESYRILKPSGYIVVGIPLDGYIPDLGKNPAHLWRAHSVAEAANVFFSNGFTIIRSEHIDAHDVFGLKHDQSCNLFGTFLLKKEA